MFGGTMNNRTAILFSLALALPCAQVLCAPKTSQEIIQDAAKRLVQDNPGAVRVGLKSGQAVGIAHLKQAIKDQAPQENQSYLDGLRTWAASHADMLADIAKTLTSDVLDRGISKNGLGTSDAVAEAYVPALAKLADKHGKDVSGEQLVQGLVNASVRAHLFADKNSNLDLVADGVETTLGFFEADVITHPAGWASYINVTKGLQLLTERAVEYVVGAAMDKAIAGKLDKQSHKTLARVLARIFVEPLNPLVERGIKSLQTEQTDEKH